MWSRPGGLAQSLEGNPVREDIVIVSQGGAPKDLNLYQTQKALENSKYAVRPGGIIILVGSCREGMGEKHFEDWMLEEKTPADVLARLERGFVLGGHKAAAIAMVIAMPYGGSTLPKVE